MYFKVAATLPLFMHEPAVMAGLAQMYSEHMPAPLCWDASRRWMLLPDIGTVMSRHEALKARTHMLQLFGTIQRDSTRRMEELFTIGAWIAAWSAWPGKSTPSCRMQSPIPPTLMHGDLHLKNVAVKAGRYQFFDWTGACVTHPFLDLTTIYNEVDVTRQAYLRDIYLALWTSYAPLEQLLEDWALAGPLCHLHQAISYQHIGSGLETSAQVEFRSMVPYLVRKVLRGLPL